MGIKSKQKHPCHGCQYAEYRDVPTGTNPAKWGYCCGMHGLGANSEVSAKCDQFTAKPTPIPTGTVFGDTKVTGPINKVNDPVNHPKHYKSHPSGIECIQVTEHMGFNLGNAVKYIWRCDEKKDAIEDLRKSVWYINREIAKREKAKQ